MPKLDIFIFIKIRYYKWGWNFEMSMWTIHTWYRKCQRMSIRHRYMVKKGQNFVHVVCECPLRYLEYFCFIYNAMKVLFILKLKMPITTTFYTFSLWSHTWKDLLRKSWIVTPRSDAKNRRLMDEYASQWEDQIQQIKVLICFCSSHCDSQKVSTTGCLDSDPDVSNSSNR